MTVHIWVEVVRDGFMNKMVPVAWTECAQVGTGEETLEKIPINTGLGLKAHVPCSSDSKETNVSCADGHVAYKRG